MRLSRFGGTLVFVAALVAFPATALADKPSSTHLKISDTFTDPDFCGTGVTVDGTFEATLTDQVHNGVFKSTGHGVTTLTNPANGAAITLSFAGPFTDTIVSGVEEGVHTHAFTFKGLPGKIQTLHGPVLLRDAGVITFLVTFDENDNVIGEEISVNKGPHPEADSGFTLGCEVMTEALGIT